jgi:hypothetical protein
MKARPAGNTVAFRVRVGLWAADNALVWGGLALVGLGLTAWPLGLQLGWMALALAFFAWVTEWNGIALPRPGRMPIRSYGCWETPLAFTVRHREKVLLFTRDDDTENGWSEAYTVRERPHGEGADPRWELPLGPEGAWTLRGKTPVGSLRFEHHERVSYVQSDSVERALALARS